MTISVSTCGACICACGACICICACCACAPRPASPCAAATAAAAACAWAAAEDWNPVFCILAAGAPIGAPANCSSHPLFMVAEVSSEGYDPKYMEVLNREPSCVLHL